MRLTVALLVAVVFSFGVGYSVRTVTTPVAGEKIVSGAAQGLLASLVVFPLAIFVPATPVHLTFRWLYLLTLTPLAAWVGAALGLVMGTRVDPRQVPLLFSIVIIPMTFLGAVYYPWGRLSPIPWLKWFVLINPLVYMSEGFRVSLTSGVPHMPTVAIYGALVGFSAFLTWLGIQGFRRRVSQWARQDARQRARPQRAGHPPPSFHP